MDEPVTNPLTLSMLNTSNDSIIGKTDIEEGSVNDRSFGDLSMISLDEQDGPNQLDITDTNMEPLTLSMLNTSQNNTSQKNSVLDETDNESFGGKRTTKRTTKRGGIRTRRDPKSSEKGQSYKATQITKKNTINKRNMNRQTMDELDNLFQNITIAPVSHQIGPN